MQLDRCPICKNRIGIEQMVQDQAGRELLGLLVTLDIDTGAALSAYLGLFRSSCRDLPLDKSLRLAREVLALGVNGTLSQAMRQTVESVQGRGTLKNHNYLKKVLADTVQPETIQPRGVMAISKPAGKTAQSLAALEEWGNETA